MGAAALVEARLRLPPRAAAAGTRRTAAPAEAPPAEPAEPPAEPPPAETGATDTGATDTGAAPPAAGFTIGMVTDTGGVDDKGFNEYSIAGLEQAAEFGFETRVYISNSAEDYLPNLTAAAEDGHALVFAAGFNDAGHGDGGGGVPG